MLASRRMADPLGVGGHDAVLDPVVHHLDEVPGAARPAVQVAVLRGAPRSSRGPGCGGRPRSEAPAWRRSGRGASPPPPRRRSSGSSRAPGPRRRRWCRRRRSGGPWPSAPPRGGCRRCNRSSRRRSGCPPPRAGGRDRPRVWSTTAAGTISQTARGCSSFCTNSSSEDAPTAPSSTSAFTDSGWTSYTTHWCPPRIRRRTMLAPIRPRPIIPSCMSDPLLVGSGVVRDSVWLDARSRIRAS